MYVYILCLCINKIIKLSLVHPIVLYIVHNEVLYRLDFLCIRDVNVKMFVWQRDGSSLYLTISIFSCYQMRIFNEYSNMHISYNKIWFRYA